LSKLGHKVGLIDADIMGYSVPNILGINYVRPTFIEDGLILPIEKFGVKVISMGNFAEENSPVIWRGPMLGKALQQFIYDVYWGDLDFMLIDLPPGTGDVPLSLIQMMPEAELLVITTPQVTAANVSQRLGLMASKTKSKITGVIENMSYFICDNCGKEHFIFGKGQSMQLAKKLAADLLGKIPMINISDEEHQIIDNPDIAKIYRDITDKILNS
jgi:ATP-binding protein involved in chromosome partitioning